MVAKILKVLMAFIRNARQKGAYWACKVSAVAATCALQTLVSPPHAHAAATTATPSSPPVSAGWHPGACPPPAERGAGPSTIKVTGPCGFQHKGEADCDADGDDLLVSVVRPAKNSAELMLFVNVERYVGPGEYKAPNDIFVSLKDGSKIYRWLSSRFDVTVGPGSKYIKFNDVRLEPELVLVGCTGPQTNYQCDGRGDEPEHMASVTTVSGTIYCKKARPKPAVIRKN